MRWVAIQEMKGDGEGQNRNLEIIVKKTHYQSLLNPCSAWKAIIWTSAISTIPTSMLTFYGDLSSPGVLQNATCENSTTFTPTIATGEF